VLRPGIVVERLDLLDGELLRELRLLIKAVMLEESELRIVDEKLVDKVDLLLGCQVHGEVCN
jgi:hypothetical protein